MKSMGDENNFYLGKFFDIKKKEILKDRLFYDPADLVTHAIVTGMTGSGKTGLCVGLLEEAALQGIPALVIDPKGDLTNLVLAFPNFAPSDFEPWIDASAARRENMTVAEVAKKTAAQWKDGLEDWGLGSKEISEYKNAVEHVIYTPGSTSGLPVNILASFEAPDVLWEENEEPLREKISATVTALLTLIGMKDIDPLRSREHILLANIIEHNWKKNSSLDLTTLIRQTQSPPIDQLGAFSLDDFFSPKDRAGLAMLLNNFLASPSFQSWIEGQSLDIQQMLMTREGKPRHSIFYLAHLNDAERMFFVTLLYSAVETWMRKQQGTSDLRALVYFDEIHGYLPPVAAPPSKPLIIRLLKTARAFGLGLVLTTQNPVDVDYKALSNAGTWMIGRLQTDQDKQRLLDGLDSAAGEVKRADFDRLISALGKRVFLYHNVHEKKPDVFHTRWAMSYLAGPMTITQVPALNQLAGADRSIPAKKTASKKMETMSELASSKPEIAAVVKEYFLDPTSKMHPVTYTPALLAAAEVRYFRQKSNIHFVRTICTLVEEPRETRQMWEIYIQENFDFNTLSSRPENAAKYNKLPTHMGKPTWWSSQEKEFEHWIYETDTGTIRTNPVLGISGGPDTSEADFLTQCRAAAQEKEKIEIDKLEKSFATKTKSLEDRIELQKMKVEKYQKDSASRGLDTALKVGESIFKLASKGRITGLSESSTKLRMSREAKARLKDGEAVLKNYQEDLEAIKSDLESEKAVLRDKWLREAEHYSEIPITPTKQNIHITHFGIAWKP